MRIFLEEDRAMPLQRPACVIAAVVVLSAGLVLAPSLAAAQAQPQPGEVVTTAQPGPGAPRANGPADETTEDVTDQDDSKDQAPVRDHKVHGEVMVGVGTNGYREVAGAVTVPVGDVGQATIAVDQRQIDYRRH
jgi:hypothetical protein